MQVFGPFWDQLITSSGLAAVAGWLIKSIIHSTIKRLDDVPAKIVKFRDEVNKDHTLLREKLAAILVRLENIDTIRDIVIEHEIKIAVIEALHNASAIKHRSDGFN